MPEIGLAGYQRAVPGIPRLLYSTVTPHIDANPLLKSAQSVCIWQALDSSLAACLTCLEALRNRWPSIHSATVALMDLAGAGSALFDSMGRESSISFN
jgi:hypothetical protein